MIKDERKLSILIFGVSQCGKNTFANALCGKLNSMGIKSVVRENAEPVKDIAKMFEWSGEKNAQGKKLLKDLSYIGYEQDKYFWDRLPYTREDLVDKYRNYTVEILPDYRFTSTCDYLSRFRGNNVYKIRIYSTNKPVNELDTIKDTFDTNIRGKGYLTEKSMLKQVPKIVKMLLIKFPYLKDCKEDK